MLTIAKNQLKAALSHASDKDVRFYLNGVLLECCADGNIHLVATDGCRMFCGLIHAANVQWTGEPQKGPFSMIIPRDAIKTALKAKTPALTLSALPDGRYTLGDVLFSPIDGRFPDWRRVIPKADREQKPGNFNWDFVAQAAQAIRDWYDRPKMLAPVFRQCGGESVADAGLMLGVDCTAFVVVMPARPNDSAEPFTPSAYETQSKAA